MMKKETSARVRRSLNAFLLFAAGIVTGKLVFTPRETIAEPPLREASSPLSHTSEISLSSTASEGGLAKRSLSEKRQVRGTTDWAQRVSELLDLSPNDSRNEHLLTLLDEWSAHDSGAAFRWLTENESRLPDLPSAYSLIMGHHMKQSPESAAALIEAMTESHFKNSLSAQFAGFLAEDDPLKSFDWSQSLQDFDARRLASGVALQALAKSDAEQAFQLALAEGNERLRDDFLDQVGLVMARKDPRALVERIDEFPDSIRAQVAQHIARSFVAIEPEATVDWIQKLPAGAERDLVIRSSLRQLIKQGSESAFMLASSVENRAKRYGMMRDVLMAHYGSDPDGALLTLQESTVLSETQKATLTADLTRNALVHDFVVPAE